MSMNQLQEATDDLTRAVEESYAAARKATEAFNRIQESRVQQGLQALGNQDITDSKIRCVLALAGHDNSGWVRDWAGGTQ